jgi:hypothetical protein
MDRRREFSFTEENVLFTETLAGLADSMSRESGSMGILGKRETGNGECVKEK